VTSPRWDACRRKDDDDCRRDRQRRPICRQADIGRGHPGLALAALGTALKHIRRFELAKAAGILGVDETICLGLPDGEIAEHEAWLADQLGTILMQHPSGVWCAATWRGDGHPDHEGVGRAARSAARRTGAVLLEYPIWMWHWALPDDFAVPWLRARSVPLTQSDIQRKRAATECFRSQLMPSDGHGPPVLPPFVVRRLLAVGEVVFV
jgi:LmbE family N-acetylglucosaminyl deacetylase